jgi:uncharacterized protein
MRESVSRVAGSLIAASIAAMLCVPFALCAAPSPDVADAAMHRDRAAVEKLIAQHADVNLPQADGATALHWAVFRSDRPMVDLLLRAGANPKAANRDGSTPLWLACINGDASIIEALLSAGADANEKLPEGRTPLMIAARTGSVDAMKVLLDHGADVNAKESLRGTTALMWAADEGHADAIRLLVQHGADIKVVSDPAERGRGPALGKSGDPRRAVKAQVQAIKEGRPTPQLGAIPLGGDKIPLQEQAKKAPTFAAPLGGDSVPFTEQGKGDGGKADQAKTDQAKTAPARGPRGRRVGAAGADQQDDQDDAFSFFRRPAPKDGGGLTALVYAARANDLESVKALLEAGADVNQVTAYGWSPLLVATQNRYYKLGAYLLDHGADVNLANKGGWTPLYLATDNRNIEGGDYPVRKPDMDHLEFIQLLLDKGANVNARMKDSTETRTVFTNQWLDENGATAFLRASQSGDIVLMKLLLAHGADPKIETVLHVNALQVAAGIGWVEGVTYEWSPAATLEAVKMLLNLGIDPNEQSDTGRTALHGAAHKGRSDVVQLLVDHGARLDIRDYGNTDNRGDAKLAGHTWLPVDYADGLVRVGVQSAIPHPETGLLIRKLMKAAGLEAPPVGRTLESVCITEACE